MTPGPTDSRAYRAEDRALLLGFYQRLFWNRLVAALPPSLKPNTITVVGEACAIAAAATTYFATRGRPLLYLASAALLFVYMTADNIDGPHARRTGQTSVLGEFLDHGLDGVASCAVLLASAFILRLEGAWIALLAAVGSAGFLATFWAQYRTGVLVAPQLSAMEGVTAAVLFHVAVFALGEPAWLRFAPGVWNPAAGILAVLALSYAFAFAAPLVRSARAGISLLEWLPVLGIIALIAGASSAGAGGILPAVSVSLFVAELVCGMIVARRRGTPRGVLSPVHGLLALVWAGACLGGRVGSVELWTRAGVALALGLYVLAFARGCRAVWRMSE